MNISKELKVGLLVSISLIIGYWGFNFLKGKEIISSTKTYYALYNNAKGLNTANEVMLNGFKVGRIQDIKILPEKDYKVLVTLVVDKNVKLTDNTIAKLNDTNLLGNKIIELIIKDGNPIHGCDTLISETEPDLQTRFAESTLPALDDARSITLLTNKFVQNLVQNTDRINSIFSNLEEASKQLCHVVTGNRKDLAVITRNMVAISNTLADEETGIQPLFMQLKQIANDVQGMQFSQLATRVDNILTTIEKGPLYGRIDQTFMNLDKLLVDLRIHPNRYIHFSIFGANSIFSKNKKKPINTTVN